MMNSDSWFLGLMTISDQPTDNADKAINRRAMSGTFNLRNTAVRRYMGDTLNSLPFSEWGF